MIYDTLLHRKVAIVNELFARKVLRGAKSGRATIPSSGAACRVSRRLGPIVGMVRNQPKYHELAGGFNRWRSSRIPAKDTSWIRTNFPYLRMKGAHGSRDQYAPSRPLAGDTPFL